MAHVLIPMSQLQGQEGRWQLAGGTLQPLAAQALGLISFYCLIPLELKTNNLIPLFGIVCTEVYIFVSACSNTLLKLYGALIK